MTCRSIFCGGASSASDQHTLLANEASVADNSGTDGESASPEYTGMQQRTFSREVVNERVATKQEAAELQQLREDQKRIQEDRDDHQARLEDAQALVARFQNFIEAEDKDLLAIEAKLREYDYRHQLVPKRPGPLAFVDSSGFGAWCNVVVLLNLTFMAEHKPVHKISPPLAEQADNIFLAWYVMELLLKTAHHRQHLFCGSILAVWWNWLDLGIVVSGVADQWVMPLLGSAGGSSSLGALRLLRLFRILRFLKIVKAFLIADLSFITDSKAWEMFMSGVISVNALSIGMELDIKWHGWLWVDNAFLVIYSFDLALRLKRWGCHFFVHPDDKYWNWLDFVVVSSGMLDSWLLPGIKLVQTEMMGVKNTLDTSKLTKIMSLVKLMRLLRVLRLVRVIRGIPPLYTMLIGVIEAFKAMQYVIVLVMITLYAGAIIFTNLVGEGLLYGAAETPPDALKFFGSVSQSLFSLFELMNGDTSVIEPIKDLLIGRIMFMVFMVISNWAILAILTAVVSDHMLAASQEYAEETKIEKEAQIEKDNMRRLLGIFEDNDDDKNGTISKQEWSEMLEDSATILELSEGTHLGKAELNDLFECLAVENDLGATATVKYRDLVESLKANSAQADKRSILHVMIRMRVVQQQLQSQVASEFDKMKALVKQSSGISVSL